MSDVSVWSEFIPFSRVREALPRLEGVGLYLAIREGEWENEDFFALWKEAAERGIELRAWLLLPRADGYWPNRWNATRFGGFVRRFVAKMSERGLTVPWVVMDLEPPPDMMEELIRLCEKGSPLAAVRLLRRYAKRGSHRAARDEMELLVSELHARGTRVHAVTFPLVLHDHSRKIESAFGILFDGIDWDEVSFMVYRPEFERLLGPMSSDLVHRYARLAHRKFGARAAIDVGQVGRSEFPIVTHGFREPARLREDASAARAAGISRIHAYSLDGMLQFPEIAPWMEAANAPAGPRPPRDWKVDALGAFVRVASAFLPKGH